MAVNLFSIALQSTLWLKLDASVLFDDFTVLVIQAEVGSLLALASVSALLLVGWVFLIFFEFFIINKVRHL